MRKDLIKRLNSLAESGMNGNNTLVNADEAKFILKAIELSGLKSNVLKLKDNES